MPATSLLLVLLSLLIGSTDSSFCASLDKGGGFSGTVGCTPSTLSQWALTDTSNGIFGNGAVSISDKSISFSSIKWSSLPPPEVNLNGRESGCMKPYWGWKLKIKFYYYTVGGFRIFKK